MILRELRRRRRAGHRQAWAADILAAHFERAGRCGHCESAFGSAAGWPCMPVRTASFYTGRLIPSGATGSDEATPDPQRDGDFTPSGDLCR